MDDFLRPNTQWQWRSLAELSIAAQVAAGPAKEQQEGWTWKTYHTGESKRACPTMAPAHLKHIQSQKCFPVSADVPSLQNQRACITVLSPHCEAFKCRRLGPVAPAGKPPLLAPSFRQPQQWQLLPLFT